MTTEALSDRGAPQSFYILESLQGEKVAVDVTVDTRVCDNCLREMRDPRDRRFGYPFINCTDCGPRYTIITALPYDRPNTTMSVFPLCPECLREYRDPGSRRFHAQATCCPVCGPALFLTGGQGPGTGDAIATAARFLEEGKIVAVKGVGGFHLACRADCEEVVQRLRQRKFREQKPFALMVRNLASAQRIVFVNESEERLLTGIESPIVLLDRRPALRSASGVVESVAPGLASLGIMLPYTPLHHLLFDGLSFNALVMTSANQTDEPMAISGDEVGERLGAIADCTLDHNRCIYVRNDDSIVRVLAGAPVVVRRARGYAPDPLPLPADATGVVGCGGILKSTVTIGRGKSAYLSQYVGAIENIVTYENYDHVLHHLLKLLNVKPLRLICDKHPLAPGLDLAQRLGLPVDLVQHHYAHACACMAENRLDEKCVCVIYDGTGYGDDGASWGGEFLVADFRSYQRVAHLEYMPMPGGDEAVHHPGRMAMGVLHPALKERAGDCLGWMDAAEKRAVSAMLETDTNCPRSSGMGRLFDGVAALLSVCRESSFEGQPAMMLEGIVDTEEKGAYPLYIIERGEMYLIRGGSLLMDVCDDLKRTVPASSIAARFHNSIVDHTVELARRIAEQHHLSTVCLTGGCFQNAILLSRTAQRLTTIGLKPVVHRLVPPNDGGISYGQVAATHAS